MSAGFALVSAIAVCAAFAVWAWAIVASMPAPSTKADRDRRTMRQCGFIK